MYVILADNLQGIHMHTHKQTNILYVLVKPMCFMAYASNIQHLAHTILHF